MDLEESMRFLLGVHVKNSIMKKIFKHQVQALVNYKNEAIASNAHIGLIFYIVVISLSIALYQTI